MENCSADYYDYGGTDSSKFGKPLPWIGVYIAAASLACGVLMFVDFFRNSRLRTSWVGSKVFAFNATTITLLAVVTKLPSDITGAMPGLFDQLTKLSGLILLCVAMEYSLPSLGAMDGRAAFSNLTALGIIVVSTFVDIWIQLHSGVISNYYFRCIYVYYSLDMLVVFLILVCHTLTVLPSKRVLYKQYYKIHEEILHEISEVEDSRRFSYDNLCKYVTRYWLMAVTSSPVYNLNISKLAVASSCLNAYPIVVIFVCGIIFVSSKLRNGNKLTCFVRSDYSWSTWLIFSIQVLTIAAGCAKSILRIVRQFHTTVQVVKKLETYTIDFMWAWDDKPLPIWISNKRIRKAMHYLRRGSIIAIWFLQIVVKLIGYNILFIHHCFVAIMTICLTTALAPALFVINAVFYYFYISRMFRNDTTMSIVSIFRDEGVRESPYGDMSNYILYLQDERDKNQVEWTARILQKYPTMWIDRGRANPPTNLDRLLRNNSLPEAFRAAREFYREPIFLSVLLGVSKEPLNCWAMPIVTLASILFLHGNSPRREELMLAVGESLRYIRLVDRNMDERGTGRMQKAADIIWEKLCLKKRWLNVELHETNSMSFNDLVKHLKEKALEDIRQDVQCNSWEYWPPKAFITNCMYTTTQTILRKQTEGSPTNLPWSVEILENVIVGLLGACLTNLPLAIFRHCSSGTFGLREEKVREAAIILGETREIMMLLESPDLRSHIPADKKYIEKWSGRSPFDQPPVIDL